MSKISISEKNKINNERFWKLSPAKKRVAIAHDVIKQLKAKKIKAEKGTYVNSSKIFLRVMVARSLIKNSKRYLRRIRRPQYAKYALSVLHLFAQPY